MANEMFTQLPTVTNAQLTDIICAVQGYVSPSSPGVSVQETLGQILTLASSNLIQSFAGNPNGNVAGTTYNLCWDSAANVLYVCTTSGSTSTAAWTPIIGQLLNGQLLIGSTGNAPIAATLTAGTNISIANASGSITISSTGAGGFSWNHVTGTSQAMLSNNGYVVDNGALVTLTLPATSAIGDEIDLVGRGVGGWRITYGASQLIKIGSSSSTVTTGNVASTAASDSLILICTAANTEWTALSLISAGLTVV
jgi:hypothetical protein